MRLFRPINLFLSSFLLLLAASCSPVHGYKLQGQSRVTEQDLNSIIPKTTSLLFKTKIDLYSKHFSGLVLVKQTDSLTQHITFVNEIGMKIFDFEIQNKQLKPVYIFEAINKPNLISVLSHDFQLMFLLNLFDSEAKVYVKEKNKAFRLKNHKKTFYLIDSNKNIQSSFVRGLIRNKLKTKYAYSIDQDLEEISLKHKGLFPIKMHLTLIPSK